METSTCTRCRAIRERIALGETAYTELRLGGSSPAQLTLLESKLLDLREALATHRCDAPADTDATRGK